MNDGQRLQAHMAYAHAYGKQLQAIGEKARAAIGAVVTRVRPDARLDTAWYLDVQAARGQLRGLQWTLKEMKPPLEWSRAHVAMGRALDAYERMSGEILVGVRKGRKRNIEKATRLLAKGNEAAIELRNEAAAINAMLEQVLAGGQDKTQ